MANQHWHFEQDLRGRGVGNALAESTVNLLARWGIFTKERLYKLTQEQIGQLTALRVISAIDDLRNNKSILIFISRRLRNSFNPETAARVLQRVRNEIEPRCHELHWDPAPLVWECTERAHFTSEQMLDGAANCRVFLILSSAGYLNSTQCLLELVTASTNAATIVKLEEHRNGNPLVNYLELRLAFDENELVFVRDLFGQPGDAAPVRQEALNRFLATTRVDIDRLCAIVRQYLETVGIPVHVNVDAHNVNANLQHERVGIDRLVNDILEPQFQLFFALRPRIAQENESNLRSIAKVDGADWGATLYVEEDNNWWRGRLTVPAAGVRSGDIVILVFNHAEQILHYSALAGDGIVNFCVGNHGRAGGPWHASAFVMRVVD